MAGSGAAEPPPEESWTFVIAPYLWLPAMSGDARVRGVPVRIDADISDIFEADFALGIKARTEAWYKERWGLLFDGNWTTLKQKDNLNGSLLEFDFRMNMGYFEFVGLYDFGARPFSSAQGSPTWSLQPLVGARLSVMKLEVDFDRFGSPDATKVWADPILGLRGILRFGNENRWQWRMRCDVGGWGAGSDVTWNASGLLAYDFQVRSVAMTFGIGARALYQDFHDGDFAWDVTQYGPMLTLGFSF